MTPNGEIYIDGVYAQDYASTGIFSKAFFIHEMAHVYQYQLNILNPISAAMGEAFKHGFDYDKAYFYTLSGERDLLDYGIEQQAQIIEDYYRMKFLNISSKFRYMENSFQEVVQNDLFGKVLKKFISNPGYAKHDMVCKHKRVNKRRTLACKRVLAN